MKKIATLTFIGITSIMAGCSSVHVEKEPTLNSIKWSLEDKKVYLRTMYVQADFKENGDRRTFNDYDFRTETSPCTVIKQYSPRTYVYTIEKDKETLNFECRPYFGYEKPDLRRLYLIGSTKDCEDRTWDYKAPVVNFDKKGFVDVKSMCKLPKRTHYNDSIEKRYVEWFK